MEYQNLPELHQLSQFVSEAVFEVLTSQDQLSKYEKLIANKAQKAQIEYARLKTDLEDFVQLFQELAQDLKISPFEEKSLLKQAQIAYIQEDTVHQLIQFVRTATTEKDQFTRITLRLPLLAGQQSKATLIQYLKEDRDFIQKNDVLCIVKVAETQYPLTAPATGRIYHKIGLGEEVAFGASICEIAEEKRSGKYAYTWADGTRYEGDFLAGELTGKGIFQYPNGDRYIGDVVEGKKSGLGRYEYANGDGYEGMFFADTMQGEGTFTIQSLENFVLFKTYTLREGKATFLLPNGDKAIGHFSNHQLIVEEEEDLGNKNLKIPCYFYANGDIYEGEIENGLPSGYGQLRYAAQTKIPLLDCPELGSYTGEFKNGLPHGRGTVRGRKGFLFGDGRSYCVDLMAYEGKFLLNYIPNLVYYEGDIAQGQGRGWMYPKMYGQVELENPFKFDYEKEELGECEWVDEYTGEFKDFKFHGEGTLLTKRGSGAESHRLQRGLPGYLRTLLTKRGSGAEYKTKFTQDYQYKGSFQQGKKHGFGSLSLSSGRLYEGTYENDIFISGRFYQNQVLIYEGSFKEIQFSNLNYTESITYEDSSTEHTIKLHYPFYELAGKYLEKEIHFHQVIHRFQVVEDDALVLNPNPSHHKAKVYMELTDSIGKILYHGKGKLYLSDDRSQYYEGDFEEGTRTGIGKIVLPYETYQGEFYKGQYQGQGTLQRGVTRWEGVFEKGNFIEGKVKDLDCNFDLFIFNGLKGCYEGSIKNGKKQGKGRISDGYNWIEGTFEQDELTEGSFYELTLGTYEGSFRKKMIWGKGKWIYNNGDKYEGELMNNLWHGEGKLLTSEGESYEGEFKEGRKHGFGKLSLKNGDTYEGEFVNDLFNGQGSLQCHNGDRYEGVWKDGMRHGQGTQIIHQEGLKAYTGIWEKDKLIKDFNKKGFFDKLFGK